MIYQRRGMWCVRVQGKARRFNTREEAVEYENSLFSAASDIDSVEPYDVETPEDFMPEPETKKLFDD